MRFTLAQKYHHMRRGVSLAASMLEVVDNVPIRCGVCRGEMGLPCASDEQAMHDELMGIVARIEAVSGLPPRCPECRHKAASSTDTGGTQRYG
jgi:hypothetical protein